MCTLSDNNFNFAFNIWGRFTVDLDPHEKILKVIIVNWTERNSVLYSDSMFKDFRIE